MNESLKLSEFLELIKSTIEMGFGYQGFWVVAELSEWRKSGHHYYGELIEHDGISKYPIAKIRCNCWANVANSILTKFKSVTGEHLKSDMKVLFKVAVNYHISFGLSLNIVDIDPSFTLGDREARKIGILDTLTKEGIVMKNKELELPLDFTNVAVITSSTAAGKGDFFEEAQKLETLGLCKFDIYEALMQGKDCALSVTKAFEKVAKKASNYDAIVLIRGGGSQADLDWFNNTSPARLVCKSKIPVLIGIGHERDSTVLDDICTKSFDTPSKVINYIANVIIDNASDAKYNYESIIKMTKNFVKFNKAKLENEYDTFRSQLENYLNHLDNKINNEYKNITSTGKVLVKGYSQIIESKYKRIFENSNSSLKYYNQNVTGQYKELMNYSKNILNYYGSSSDYLYRQILSVSIEPTLKRGFSITKSREGKFITTKEKASKQKNLIIVYSDGIVNVEVENGNAE
ncbi:exodeoxyribonuclease VII large subunit [Pseudofrancisella aestuarii]|uniref:Exodeoxyribonuclease 7 large subunit n=1 Tax=Pseudofrancisella aestuarii TaxID=2670347 RepID=A0ABV9TC21_9GAMM|nr:exodeoxyribonuclease VII large subunit [Pseudofrancisella aestuarii]